MRILASVFLVVALTCTAFAQHEHATPGGSYGSVSFRTSCAPDVQPDFESAVAMLHSFAYENAKHAFEDIATWRLRRNPSQWCVTAFRISASQADVE